MNGGSSSTRTVAAETELAAQHTRSPGRDVGHAPGEDRHRIGHRRREHDRERIEQESWIHARSEDPRTAGPGPAVEVPSALGAKVCRGMHEAGGADHILARVGAPVEHLVENLAPHTAVQDRVELWHPEHLVERLRRRHAELLADRQSAQVMARLGSVVHDPGEEAVLAREHRPHLLRTDPTRAEHGDSRAVRIDRNVGAGVRQIR